MRKFLYHSVLLVMLFTSLGKIIAEDLPTGSSSKFDPYFHRVKKVMARTSRLYEFGKYKAIIRSIVPEDPDHIITNEPQVLIEYYFEDNISCTIKNGSFLPFLEPKLWPLPNNTGFFLITYTQSGEWRNGVGLKFTVKIHTTNEKNLDLVFEEEFNAIESSKNEQLINYSRYEIFADRNLNKYQLLQMRYTDKVSNSLIITDGVTCTKSFVWINDRWVITSE